MKKTHGIQFVVVCLLVGLLFFAYSCSKREKNESKSSGVAKIGNPVILELVNNMVDIPGNEYKICKYEVTQAEWEAVMGENPSRFKGYDRPVEGVSWYDCQRFLKKLNAMPEVKMTGLTYRLPMAEEWLYAYCAGGSGSEMADGSEITEDTFDAIAWCEDNSGGETHSVGQKQPNAWGLYDMFGNVYEWTSTFVYDHYEIYGGCWLNNAAECMSRPMSCARPNDRDNRYGLRLVAEIVEENRNQDIAQLLKHLDAVSIPGKEYKMCKYEVTQAVWEEVMIGRDNPSKFKGSYRPVENVSWDDCQEFLEELNAMPEIIKTGLMYRLPTVEEWEHACRAGSPGDYCKMADGSEITSDTLDSVAWHHNNSATTRSVGQKLPNAWGLYDMLGNVYEWTSSYAYGRETDRDCDRHRKYCGGSWINPPGSLTSGEWMSTRPDNRCEYVGFRLVAEPRQ